MIVSSNNKKNDCGLGGSGPGRFDFFDMDLKRHIHNSDEEGEGGNFSSSSSGSSSSYNGCSYSDDDQRHHRTITSKKSKDSKKKKGISSSKKRKIEKKHKKSSSSRSSRRRDEKKRRKEKKDRKRKERDYDSSSDANSSPESHNSEHKRSRKEPKSKKRLKREKQDEDGDVDRIVSSHPPVDPRSTNLARALNSLLRDHAPMATELPLILIRLAGGTMMDLRHMTNASAAQGLQTVLSCLEPFGVAADNHVWSFSTPASGSSRQRRDELVLLRVVRSLLDEVGVNMETVLKFECSPVVNDEDAESSRPSDGRQSNLKPSAPSSLSPHDDGDSERDILQNAMRERTMQFLTSFLDQDASLGQQLAGLCATIASGESVSIDGLPDERLKEGLSSLFEACGLEKSEMEEQADEDDDDDNESDVDEDSGPTFGYGLPDGMSRDDVCLRLAAVMETCREKPRSRRVMGPMIGTPEDIDHARKLPSHERNAETNEYDDNDDEDDDEGPLLPNAVPRGPTIPLELIKAQAERRELELKATAAGVDIPLTDASGREEWILLPGKYDFLSGIKTGQTVTKSRGFQNKKVGGTNDEVPPAVHPAIQRELDKIIAAHEEARGPSLMEQHRQKVATQKEAAAAEAAARGSKKNWDWNRDKDLDAGRRVDKDALRMVLGGAADGLKTKFQGGLNH